MKRVSFHFATEYVSLQKEPLPWGSKPAPILFGKYRKPHAKKRPAFGRRPADFAQAPSNPKS